MEALRQELLEAILPHVTFDGWSTASFDAAVADCGIAPALARSVCPRGALDLAVAFHESGDAQMREKLAELDLSALRFQDRVRRALEIRLEIIPDKEAVRRASTLFALPQHAPDGARLVWNTADAIWTALGDSSRDGNWYSKRMILSGVYSASVIYWLGDDTENMAATRAFIDRRIADVMRFEAAKVAARKSTLLKPLATGADWLMRQIPAPNNAPSPGRWKG